MGSGGGGSGSKGGIGGGGGGGGGGGAKDAGGPAGPATGATTAPDEIVPGETLAQHNATHQKLFAEDLPQFPNDPVVNPGGKLTGPGVKVENAKAEAIHGYTGGKVPGGERFKDMNAEKLNQALYDPEAFVANMKASGYTRAQALQKAKQYKDELNAELNALKSYQGEVYRVVGNSQHGGQYLSAKYQVGKVAKHEEFLSTSKSIRPSYQPFQMAKGKVGTGANAEATKIRFVIKSKSGKLIEGKSNFVTEEEVLFGSGKSFMVTKKTLNRERGTWDIHMTEL